MCVLTAARKSEKVRLFTVVMHGPSRRRWSCVLRSAAAATSFVVVGFHFPRHIDDDDSWTLILDLHQSAARPTSESRYSEHRNSCCTRERTASSCGDVRLALQRARRTSPKFSFISNRAAAERRTGGQRATAVVTLVYCDKTSKCRVQQNTSK